MVTHYTKPSNITSLLEAIYKVKNCRSLEEVVYDEYFRGWAINGKSVNLIDLSNKIK